ncbi:MAG: molybdopterin-dependent oxidoreductase [Chloroflexi bacterium]|nr:molybdopterin-dependent oxidoreductase [Chloroflexota bacterium]
MATEFAVVGKRLPRFEGNEKVTGEARYIADITLPGVIQGKILRSPYPHARILNIDTSRARRLPGVRGVVTAQDTLKRRWGAFQQDQPVLAIDKVRYVGEEVAAVAAVDEETALEALSLIDVEYEELPPVFDPEAAMEPDAPLVHEDKERNIAMRINVERGDVAQAFAHAHCVVEEAFQSTLHWHAAIETIGSVAHFSGGKLTLWMNTQTLFMARHRVAWAMGLREGDVRIIQSAVGGGFGGKSCDDNNAMVCALLAMKTGRPVRIINEREEEFLAGSRPRVPMKVYIKMGFRRDGLILAKELRIIADNGAYTGKAAGILSVAALRHDTCYKFENVKTDAYLVYTNKIPTGAFRGFGNPSIEFALEQALDMGAEKLGLDPVAVARLNAAEPGYVSPHGNRVGSCELKKCIDEAARLIGWEEKQKHKVLGRGLGVGCTAHVSGKRHFGDYDGGSALIKVNEDGKVYIWSGEGEIGQGTNTVLCQIAAEELGVPIEDVEISTADTDLTPYCHGAYASRLTYIAGNAVKAAAAEAKRQLLEVAGESLEANPQDLEIQGGRIYVQGAPEGRSTTVAEAAYSRLFRRGGAPIVGFGSFDPDSQLSDQNRYGNESGAYNFACQAAEVAVDTETGQVKVLSYVSVADCGTVVNPVGAEGQLEGSIAQGLGYALAEGLTMEEGRPLNPNFHDYKILTMADMPPFQRDFVPSYEPTGPFGAKGLGELGMDPVAAVIANAINDAVGVRITTLPITPEKVLKALREKGKTG